MGRILVPGDSGFPVFGDQPDLTHPSLKGLVGWWPLNEGGGSVAYDLTKKNNGTHVKAQTYAVGPRGRCLAVSTTEQSVNVTGVSAGTTHTISMWFKATHTLNSAYGEYLFDSEAGRVVVGWTVINNLGYYNGSWSHTSTPLNDGLWHLITIVDVAGAGHIYVDGSLDAAVIGSAKSIGGVTRIGDRWLYDATTRPILGGIHDVRVYNRALSADEVKRIYYGLDLPEIFAYAQDVYFDSEAGGALPTLTAINASLLTSSGARLTVT